MLWLLLPPVLADTLETGTLSSETVIYIDMRAGEALNFWLRSVPICTDESGKRLSDEFILTGAFTVSRDTLVRCVLTGDEAAPTATGQPWYFKVIDTTTRPFGEPTGRIYSYAWVISAPDADFSHTFYTAAPVNSDDPLDAAASSRVITLETAGLRGEDLRISASSTGIPGVHVQSDAYSATIPDRLPVYLSAPEEPRAATLPSEEADWSLAYASSVEGCEGIIPGTGPAVLASSSSLTGLLGFVCDIDQDGTLDYSGQSGDLLGGLTPAPADAAWTWDGTDATGSGFVAPGSYWCFAGTFLGAAHALIENADVADPGVRLFERIDDTTTDSLPLYWNDLLLQDEVPLASGEVAPLQSGTAIASGSPADPADPPENAHGWGNPDEAISRGSIGWIDTWTPGTFSAHGSEKVVILDPDSDADGDGLPLHAECTLGTRPGTEDSDGDGVGDGQEVEDDTDPLDPTDFKTVDTGLSAQDDTAAPAADSLGDLFGDFSGGAFSCTAAPAGAGRGLALLGLLGAVLRRRRVRGCESPPCDRGAIKTPNPKPQTPNP